MSADYSPAARRPGGFLVVVALIVVLVQATTGLIDLVRDTPPLDGRRMRALNAPLAQRVARAVPEAQPAWRDVLQHTLPSDRVLAVYGLAGRGPKTYLELRTLLYPRLREGIGLDGIPAQMPRFDGSEPTLPGPGEYLLDLGAGLPLERVPELERITGGDGYELYRVRRVNAEASGQ